MIKLSTFDEDAQKPLPKPTRSRRQTEQRYPLLEVILANQKSNESGEMIESQYGNTPPEGQGLKKNPLGPTVVLQLQEPPS